MLCLHRKTMICGVVYDPHVTKTHPSNRARANWKTCSEKYIDII